MESIINTVLELLKDNFPLILSTGATLFSVFCALRQFNLSKKVETMSLYSKSRFSAYERLLNEIAHLGTNVTEEGFYRMLSASLNASILSSEKTGNIIESFCKIYGSVLSAGGFSKISEDLGTEFIAARLVLVEYLRKEIFQYEKSILGRSAIRSKKNLT